MFAVSPVKTTFHGVKLGRSPPFSIAGERSSFLARPRFERHRLPRSGQVRAVISREEKAVEEAGKSSGSPISAPDQLPRPSYGGSKSVTAVVKIRKKMKEKLTEKVEHQLELLMKAIGQGILLQLVSEEIDPETKTGRRSLETPVRGLLEI